MVFLSLSVVAGLFASIAWAYDNSRSDNLVVYYGQNSYGATHSDTGNWQQRLSRYCQDDTINAFPLAFLNVYFGTGGLPEINMANTCNSNDNGNLPGTGLANCQFLQEDIKGCQAKGKIVTLSLGGATGAATFMSDAQAQQFADTVWNIFLGGSSSTRPFGNAVLDGIDLDIEGGSSTGYVAFVNRIRSHANGASKKYYVTAAPQCPFPDAYLGPILNAASFDAVYVQFYNNYCSVASGGSFNFAQWDQWAKTQSPNKNVKIFIGAPASPTAAGSGYVDASTLGRLAQQTKAQYSSFGGVMLWDASQAYGNNRFDVAIKNALTGGTGGGGGGGGAPAWSSSVAYNGGAQVTYNGHLWTAKWWTQAETPGGSSGVWTDNGACFTDFSPETSAAAESTSAASPESTAASSIQPSSSIAEATPTSESSAAASASSSAVDKTDGKTAAKDENTDNKDKDTVNNSETRPQKASRFFRL
ncbi:Chitinase 2 [Marasmius tenuissimus]|nr:Chitinase 2 [Marasmius tenuissimus]